MPFDPWRPPAPAPGRKSDPEIKPTDEDVVRALVEIQKASSSTQPSADRPIHLVPERPWLLWGSAAWWLPVMAIMGVAAAVGISYATRRLATSTGKNAQANSGPARTWRVDPAKQAEAFSLHCVEDWSYQEIAQHLAVSLDAVGVLLHRARQRLRRLLAAFHESPPTSPSQTARLRKEHS